MRVVIDLQGAQAENRLRGIGRYSLSLAQAIVRNRGEHEVIVALNDQFPETIDPIRSAFDGMLPQENIRVWTSTAPVNALDPSNRWRREAAELIREAFLAGLQPDFILVPSLFEGLVDDAVTSIGVFTRGIPTAVTIHDMIPFIYQKLYLNNPVVENWYLKKIDHILRADLLLAVSLSSCREGREYLGFTENFIINVSEDVDSRFHKLEISAEEKSCLIKKFRLTRPFLMYTGGIDHRKNIEGLIRAYARLSNDIRRNHQLAVVCSVQPESQRALENLARQEGLKADEVIFTGFVSDDDLVSLYNLCRLFVFPSWHEGFGLPALEAMRCGAPVIAANTSSLPEVIGREDALFDPFSEEAIAAKIVEVLTNESFREKLIHHSYNQSKEFSWDKSAYRAIAALERFCSEEQKNSEIIQPPVRRPKLAYISPLPPEKSGISDYSAELLPQLARHYDIEVIVAQPEVSDPWIRACLPIRSVEYFVQHADHYDRVLYHFGNSQFHQHMFDLLDRFPGVVVLHDFFLSGIKAHLELNGYVTGAWVQELYKSHGYVAVWESFHAENKSNVIFKYPCNFSVIQQAIGVIVHSTYSLSLAQEWYGNGLAEDWSVIPLLRVPARVSDPMITRKKLGVAPNDFIVCSFGMLGPIKQNHRLLRAWLSSSLAQDPHCRLIFVGENDSGVYGQRLLNTIRQRHLKDRISITGWADSDTYRDYLTVADVAVQLRKHSRGESSAAILDSMNHALPTIVNASGSLAELPKDAVWMLPDEFEDTELIVALETLWKDPERRHALGLRARKEISTRHAPRACAEQYARAIETFYDGAENGSRALVDALARIENMPSDEGTLAALAAAVNLNLPPKRPAHQLLVDISELVQQDVKSGIQRVTRSILKELIMNPPPGYRVEPVYATVDSQGYRYAGDFAFRFLECPADIFPDDPIEPHPGDIFLGLDLQPHVIPAQRSYLESLHHRGVRVYFVVYDMLPILLPHAFLDGAEPSHTRWLNTIAQFDGALCISRTVVDDFTEWLKTNGPKRLRPFKVGWFHLGADVENSVPTTGLPDDAFQVLSQLSSRPSFLMVGTIEPRKNHAQALAAFEKLWEKGLEANLAIVGKQGWMVETLVESLRNHPGLGKRLFWLEGISDEYLEKVYAASACLIAASEGEGFGLPLIEAAQHKLPILARDIPAFREVAGDYAFYFAGNEPADLAMAVQEWLKLYRSGGHPVSEGMPWLTWKQSTAKLKEYIFGKEI